jgi:hypothetical protein
MRALLLLLAFSGAAHAAPTLDTMAAQLSLDADSLARVRAGKLVQLSRPDTSDRDLAVGFAFLCGKSPQALTHAFRDGDDLSSDGSLVAWHPISQVGAAHDFDSLHLSPHGADEAKRYLSARAGEALNLSDQEITAFDALGPSASQAQVEALLHKTLLARHDAYRRGGFAALAPYARDKGQRRDLGEGLRVFAQAPAAIRRYSVAASALLRSYPQVPDKSEQAFYWLVYDHDGRPTLALRHRLFVLIDDVTLMVDREFYVSQGYNEMQALVGLAPTDAGTLVFYRVDTSTDRVSGASSGVKHSVGRRMMGKQLAAIFERTRQKLCR